jgi:transposase
MRAHLIRHCKGVLELHPTQQQWAADVITVLREAAAAVTEAITDKCDQLDAQLLADLRQRYDHAVGWGIITNRQGRTGLDLHPKLRRALDKQRQRTSPQRCGCPSRDARGWMRVGATPVAPATSASLAPIHVSDPKRHQAVSSYWHTLTTLAGYCRVRSYLVSTRGHGVRAIDAIHAALTGNPWLPRIATA